jgi:hypothetical protein
METTILKSKMPKKMIFIIGAALLMILTSTLIFFSNNTNLEFIKKYFENSSIINIIIIALIFLTPLFGFLIPYNKTNPIDRAINPINNKRRLSENRRKKELMRLMNVNSKRY